MTTNIQVKEPPRPHEEALKLLGAPTDVIEFIYLHFIPSTTETLEGKLQFIAHKTSDYFNLPYNPERIDNLIDRDTRKRESVYPRQVAHYFAYKYTVASLSTIGRVIGNRDHATVLHSVKAIRNLLSYDEVVMDHIKMLNRIFFRKFRHVVERQGVESWQY